MTRKWKEGRVKKEQSAGIKRGGKIQKLTVVDVDKQYLDSLKEIGKELRRSLVRISITILIEQKGHRMLNIPPRGAATQRGSWPSHSWGF
jgi:hypothetical protein